MRDSVRLNFWESLLVTFSSVSSETWVMYSSAIPGISVFCDWLFLVFSGVSLEIAANFLLFLNLDIILREKLVSCEDWKDFYFRKQIDELLFYELKGFNTMQTINDAKFQFNTRKTTIFYGKNNSTFVFPIYTFSLTGIISLYTNSGYNYGKYLIDIIYKVKMPNLAKKTPFRLFLFS